jgi:hypothetical protein
VSNDVIKKERTLISKYVTTKVEFFSFGEILCCDKRKIHTKVLFEENGQKTPDFEELFFEIVRFK